MRDQPTSNREADMPAPTRIGSGDLLGACVEFIKLKLAKAEMTLAQREAMEKCWREGTDESWRAAGCHMSKSKRLEASARHGRIAVKNREEVAMFKAVLHQLAPNDQAHPTAADQKD